MRATNSGRGARRGLAWAAAVALGIGACALSAPTPAEGGTVSKRYRDRNAKFSFRVFDDWDPIPLETEGKSSAFGGGGTEKFAVCKYTERGASQRGAMAADLFAYRMGGGAVGIKSAGETTPGEGEKPADPFLEALKKRMGSDDPATMRDLFAKILSDYSYLDEPRPALPTKPTKPKKGEAQPADGPPQPTDWEAEKKREHDLAMKLLDEKAAKAIKSKDGVPGAMWILERTNPRASWTTKPFYLVFAAFKKDQMEVGFWLTCEGERKKKFEQGFKQIVSSFLWFDDQAEDVESKAELEGLAISPAKRRAIERGLVQGWDVLVSPKKNYVILYNTKGRRNDLLAKMIGERIEQIRAQVYEVQFPSVEPITTVCIARICGDRAEYHAYGGPGGSAGYWNSDTEELVFYDASPAKEPDDDTLAVLYHEAFHQYIYYSVGEVAPHSWFNEGHGDYYAGSKYVGKKFDLKPFRWRTGVIQNALVKGPSPYEEKKDEKSGEVETTYDRSKGGYTPLAKFVRMSQGEYYSYPDVCYAQGWSLIYFLREYVPKNPKWAEKWGKILTIYFDTLKAEANKEKPLVRPTVPKPGPAMGDPAMDEPAMDDPAEPPATPDEPPAMGEGGTDDGGGMGDAPGMGDTPGMGDEPPEPTEGGFVMPSFRFRGSRDVLDKAVEAAFKGVDFAELEAAWRETMKHAK